MALLKNRGAVAIWDLVTLAGLSGERDKVLLVSDRTLHLLARLDKTDTPKYYRYAKEVLDGDFYQSVEETDQDEVDLVDEIANNFGIEVVPMSDIRRVIHADLYLSSDQVIANNTSTAVQFDSRTYDPDNLADTDAGTISIPRDGMYQINATVRWAANPTGRRFIIVTNGDISLVDSRDAVSIGATLNRLSQAIYLNEGDSLAMFAFQASGGNLSLDSEYPTSPYRVQMSITGF